MLSVDSSLLYMVLNFLSIPGRCLFDKIFSANQLSISSSSCSTNVKHALLKGSLRVSRFCHVLSDVSTCASTVLSLWATLDGAISHGVISKNNTVELFKNKHKSKKRARAENDIKEIQVME